MTLINYYLLKDSLLTMLQRKEYSVNTDLILSPRFDWESGKCRNVTLFLDLATLCGIWRTWNAPLSPAPTTKNELNGGHQTDLLEDVMSCTEKQNSMCCICWYAVLGGRSGIKAILLVPLWRRIEWKREGENTISLPWWDDLLTPFDEVIKLLLNLTTCFLLEISFQRNNGSHAVQSPWDAFSFGMPLLSFAQH